MSMALNLLFKIYYNNHFNRLIHLKTCAKPIVVKLILLLFEKVIDFINFSMLGQIILELLIKFCDKIKAF
jgi:hypothetical protein